MSSSAGEGCPASRRNRWINSDAGCAVARERLIRALAQSSRERPDLPDRRWSVVAHTTLEAGAETCVIGLSGQLTVNYLSQRPLPRRHLTRNRSESVVVVPVGDEGSLLVRLGRGPLRPGRVAAALRNQIERIAR